MTDEERYNLIDRLQGFDGDALRSEMTDGLEDWCGKRYQRSRLTKRVLVIGLLLLTTTAIAMSVVPLLRMPAANEEPADRQEQTTAATAAVNPADSNTLRADLPAVPLAVELPVDYHYKGIAEDGYSVTYGRDTRTLTYTRYSGSHLISSVVHNAPDDLFRDTVEPAVDVQPEVSAPKAVRSTIACDFQSVSPSGDALYYTVTDSLSRTVSVRGDVAEWMGQRIYYNDSLVLPAAVEHDGVLYTVTAVADSAFAGHDELRTVVLPASIERLGDEAFARCTGLGRLLVLAALPPEAGPATFDRTDAHLLLTVPCGSRKAYENDVEWLYFRNIVEDCDPQQLRPRIRVIRR